MRNTNTINNTIISEGLKIGLGLLWIMVVAYACSGDESDMQEEVVDDSSAVYVFEDSFEVETTTDELFPLDGSRWTGIQQVNPEGESNEIDITDEISSDGSNALRIISKASNTILSKIDIEKEGFQAFQGDAIEIKADFYVASSVNLSELFLIDLKCCSCWDPNVATSEDVDTSNQCPGVRLKMSGGNDFLSIERGKIAGSTIEQTSYAFPRNQWVTVIWTMQLSDEDDGFNRLVIDGNEVISSTGINMPNLDTFSAIFAEFDIDFSLQEPVFYERVQIGATANPTEHDIELLVDNFSLTIENN